MSIYRKYSWNHRGHSFWYEKYWSEQMLKHLEGLPHDITNTAEYWHYVYNDPYSDELIDFLDDLTDMGSEYIDFNEDKDVLEFLLSFVQHLNYYTERGEYPRYPTETVIDRGGDCEDTAILMAFVADHLGYRSVLLGFSNEGFMGIGAWGHCDLAIASNYGGEFSGTYWRSDGERFYYVSCNGEGRQIGEYSGKWGHRAMVFPDNYYS